MGRIPVASLVAGDSRASVLACVALAIITDLFGFLPNTITAIWRFTAAGAVTAAGCAIGIGVVSAIIAGLYLVIDTITAIRRFTVAGGIAATGDAVHCGVVLAFITNFTSIFVAIATIRSIAAAGAIATASLSVSIGIGITSVTYFTVGYGDITITTDRCHSGTAGIATIH